MKLFCFKSTGTVVATTDGNKDSKFVNVVNLKDDHDLTFNNQVENNSTLEYTDKHSLLGR